MSPRCQDAGSGRARGWHSPTLQARVSRPLPPDALTRLDASATAVTKLELPALSAPVYGIKIPQPFPVLRSISKCCTPRGRIGEACQGSKEAAARQRLKWLMINRNLRRRERVNSGSSGSEPEDPPAPRCKPMEMVSNNEAAATIGHIFCKIPVGSFVIRV